MKHTVVHCDVCKQQMDATGVNTVELKDVNFQTVTQALSPGPAFRMNIEIGPPIEDGGNWDICRACMFKAVFQHMAAVAAPRRQIDTQKV